MIFFCDLPRAIDGDTLACANMPANVRLVAIDAPELPGHCHRPRVCTPGDGFASRALLASLVARGTVQCISTKYDRYRRILARCAVGVVDLSCTMVLSRAAVERYSKLGGCRRIARPARQAMPHRL